MHIRTHITCIVALCAVLSSTAMVLFAGIAAACSGSGGGGGCTAPTVSTGSATSITSKSATLNGSVNPQGCETTYTFEWGTSASGSYPDSITGSAGNGTSSKSVWSNLPSGILQPSTKYNFRLKATNSGGTTTGSTSSFTTLGATETCPQPTVTTDVATSITDVSAMLNGIVNPHGCATTYKFEWGPSSSPSSYPNSTIADSAGSGTVDVYQQNPLSGLQPGTGYHFRISASKSNGTWINGADKPFTTLSAPQYLAMGDSYSAGTGTGSDWVNSTSDAATCHRTKQSYPYLLAKAHPNWTFINATCHGAVTSNMLNGQIPSQVSPNIKWITYTIGGNDAGFSNVIKICVLPWYDDANCESAVLDARTVIENVLPSRLDNVNNAIKAKAPNAKVIVFDYPRLFNEKLCSAFLALQPYEQALLNVASEKLRTVISAATARAGSKFVFRDVIPGFATHAVCEGGSGSSTEWIWGLTSPEEESYHPKVAGHANVYYPLATGVTG